MRPHTGILALALGLGLPATGWAQHERIEQPYAGEQHRAIKALSEKEVADLLAGEGMRLALAAELNGYPGPRHALDMAEQLALSGEQADRTRAIYDEMKAEAIRLGERIVELEADLDRRFASGSVAGEPLAASLEEIGILQARLRGAHLRAHVALLEVLTSEQVARYAELRGYGGGGDHGHSPAGGH